MFHFQKTLFLDCDTEVNGDLTPMFDCLDRFDIGWWPTIDIDAALSRKMDFPGGDHRLGLIAALRDLASLTILPLAPLIMQPHVIKLV